MNPVVLKMIASLMNSQSDLQGRSLEAGTDLSNFSTYLNAAQKESLQAENQRLPFDSSFHQTPYDFYMASFKKALLAKGKPLGQCALKGEDLPLFKKLLAECGFPQEKMDRLLKDLLQNNPTKEINFSRFFQKIAELDSTLSKKQSGNFFDPAAVPHLEFILRNFGMSPEELERAFGFAKVGDGRLNLDKFVVKLKEITGRPNSAAPVTALQKLDEQLADKIKMLGFHIPDPDRSGRISLKAFISLLEKASGKPEMGHKLPAGIKSTIEQVVSKTVVSGQKPETAVSMPHGGEPFGKQGLLSPLLDKVQPDSESVLFAPFKEQSMPAAQKGSWPSLKDKNKIAAAGGRWSSIKGTEKTGENEKRPAFAAEKNGGHIMSEPHSMTSDDITEKVKMLGEFYNNRDLKHEVKQEVHAFRSETKIVHTLQQMTAGTLSEVGHGVEQTQKPAQDFLPAYLVNQVGKQISKALSRADRVIKLQLKPPELGAVKIEMDIKENVLKLEMIAESSSVKEVLLSNLNELRDALIEQGIKVEELDVQVSQDFNRSLANSEENLKERQAHIRAEGRDMLIAENTMDDPASDLRIRASGDHLLNLVA